MANARRIAQERALAAWNAWHDAVGRPREETEAIYEIALACQIRFERLVALQEIWRAAVYRSHAG